MVLLPLFAYGEHVAGVIHPAGNRQQAGRIVDPLLGRARDMPSLIVKGPAPESNSMPAVIAAEGVGADER